MARKRLNGVDPIVEAIRELGRNLGGRIDQTNERLERVEGRIEQTNERLARVEGRIDQTNERVERVEQGLTGLGQRIDRTNERIDTLAQATAVGFTRMETRLEEIARNTGTSYRELGARVDALEAWRRMQGPDT